MIAGDVLAVMDHIISVEKQWGDHQLSQMATEARAAVAELIEAADLMRANFRCVLATNCKCDDDFIAKQTEQFDAALARCKGGAA